MCRAVPVSIRRANAAAHAAAPGVTGLLTKPSFRISNMFGPTERSSVASSAVLDPRSVIELELAYRLASLFWRLRRAGAIETGLFEFQGEALPARWQDPSRGPRQPGTPPTRANGHSNSPGSNGRVDPPASNQEPPTASMRPRLGPSRAITQCFLRLSHLDPTLLDRAGSYETRLWRQAAQTIWTLEAMRQPPPPMRQRLRHRVAPFTWDRER
jgi:hypothetical protein